MDAARALNPSGTAWRTTWKPRGVEDPQVHFVDRWPAARLQRAIEPVAVRLELWDGTSPYRAPSPPIGDVIVRDRRALLGLIVNPDVWFGEAYMAGRLEVRGSLEPVVEALSHLSAPAPSWLARVAAELASPNSLTRARQNVHHHYDLGNAFYDQWLDSELAYTCAYFADPELPLDQAQQATIELVCRKLRLRPGERVVEAGCGGGALALHRARRHGVRVMAFNISREQIAYARERAIREGLHDRVEFVEDDYRSVQRHTIRSARRMAIRFVAPGSCTSRVRKPPLRLAGCNCSRSCSRRWNHGRTSGHKRSCTPIQERHRD